VDAGDEPRLLAGREGRTKIPVAIECDQNDFGAFASPRDCCFCTHEPEDFLRWALVGVAGVTERHRELRTFGVSDALEHVSARANHDHRPRFSHHDERTPSPARTKSLACASIPKDTPTPRDPIGAPILRS